MNVIESPPTVIPIKTLQEIRDKLCKERTKGKNQCCDSSYIDGVLDMYNEILKT